MHRLSVQTSLPDGVDVPRQRVKLRREPYLE